MEHLGFKMAPSFFFPALPKVIQDIWVAVELFVTLLGFIASCISFDQGNIPDTLSIALSLAGLGIAMIDGFIYFVEGGSCLICFKWGYQQVKKRMSKEIAAEISEEVEGGSEENGHKKISLCRFLPERVRKVIATGSEVVRVSLTEFILYPLMILDVLELIELQSYSLDNRDNKLRLNFSLFIIGIFYLSLTVYFLRLLMSVTFIMNINRLPKTTTSSYHLLLRKFSVHLVAQMFVHIIIQVMVATKIDSEQCVLAEGSGGNQTFTNISPFLYVTMFTGGIIPFSGVAMFFVVNFSALKEFSMGFGIDMLSSIVSQDFASTAFSGEGLKQVKEKVTIIEQNNDTITLAKHQLNTYSNLFSLKKKFAYQLTNPLILCLSNFYFAILSVFLICHALGWNNICDSNSGVQFVSFSHHKGVFVSFILGVMILAIANYQVIFIALICLAAIIGLMTLVITLPILLFILIPSILILAGILWSL